MQGRSAARASPRARSPREPPGKALSIPIDQAQASSDDDRLRIERVDERREREAELVRGFVDERRAGGIAQHELRSLDPGSLGQRQTARSLLDGGRADHDRVAARARIWVAVQDEAVTHAAADREVEERLEPTGLAKPRLGHGRRTHVGLDADVRTPSESPSDVQVTPVDGERARRPSREVYELAQPDPHGHRSVRRELARQLGTCLNNRCAACAHRGLDSELAEDLSRGHVDGCGEDLRAADVDPDDGHASELGAIPTSVSAVTAP